MEKRERGTDRQTHKMEKKERERGRDRQTHKMEKKERERGRDRQTHKMEKKGALEIGRAGSEWMNGSLVS